MRTRRLTGGTCTGCRRGFNQCDPLLELVEEFALLSVPDDCLIASVQRCGGIREYRPAACKRSSQVHLLKKHG